MGLHHIDDLVQDCSNSSALAMELLQSCAKPSIFGCKDSALPVIICDIAPSFSNNTTKYQIGSCIKHPLMGNEYTTMKACDYKLIVDITTQETPAVIQ